MTRVYRSMALAMVIAAALLAAVALPAAAISLPEGFNDEVVLSDLTVPTAIDFASDGRIFVAEKSGVIKVFANPSAAPTVFADLRARVHNSEDRGLLSLKLHPNFPSTPYLYIAYALDAPIGEAPPKWGNAVEASDPCPESGCLASGRLSRLQVAGSTMSGDETVMIENWCQQFANHSLGGIAFGPEGALYIGAGEGASALDVDYGQSGRPKNACDDPPDGYNHTPSPRDSRGGALRAQNIGAAADGRATYAGKILRIDPITGAVLPDNPLAGNSVPGADRIIARGLRQPFRLAIRPGTNEVWAGDVGWGDWEEINRVQDPRGAVTNFGWPCFQGPEADGSYAALGNEACEALYAQPSSHQPPFFTYAHDGFVVPGEDCSPGSSAITGLTFYDGGAFPQNYQGSLFFADYARNCIWVMFADGDGVPNPETRATFASAVAAPVDLQIGPDGGLYYIDVVGGTVRRITYASGNRPPSVTLHANVTNGAAPLTVQFDASQSNDPEGGPLTFRWDLDGNGSTDATGPTQQFTYTQLGPVKVTVTVIDRLGAQSQADVTISIGNQSPRAHISEPTTALHWRVGQEIVFRGEGEDPEDGALPERAYKWSLLLHHCPHDGCHIHFLEDFEGVDHGSFDAEDHEYPSHLELQLTVTDSSGLTATDSVLLNPATADLFLETDPDGLRLAVGPINQTAPFSQTMMARSRITVTAPSPQRVGCNEYSFVSWSDGGARTHEITVKDEGLGLRARFEARVEEPCIAACAGDCDADGAVQVAELLTVVNIAVSQQSLDRCLNGDLNSDGAVTVEEILAAISSALDGCPAVSSLPQNTQATTGLTR